LFLNKNKRVILKPNNILQKLSLLTPTSIRGGLITEVGMEGGKIKKKDNPFSGSSQTGSHILKRNAGGGRRKRMGKFSLLCFLKKPSVFFHSVREKGRIF
jgi:hypothetical protein